MAFKTQFPFRLPRGYVDEEGNVHRDGVMRLATARDEILPLQDYRVQIEPRVPRDRAALARDHEARRPQATSPST